MASIIQIAFVIALAAVFFIPFMLIQHYSSKRNKATHSLIALFFLIYFMILFAYENGLLDSHSLTHTEMIPYSIIQTIKTFSFSGDYPAYISAATKFMTDAGLPYAAPLFGLFIAILGVATPLFGSAFLLGILADIFPYLRIKLHPNKEKIVFSHLNLNSLAIATNILNTESDKVNWKSLNHTGHDRLFSKNRPPMIIFCSVYPETFQEAELISRAKEIGALCLAKEMSDLNLIKTDRTYYFLIHPDSSENILNLSSMIKPATGQLKWKNTFKYKNPSKAEFKESNNNENEDFDEISATSFFIFLKSDREIENIKQVINKSEVSINAMIRPILMDRNIFFHLAEEIPFFLPLLYEEDKQNLTITVCGTGTMIKTFIKNVIWTCQFKNTRLILNICTPDPKTLQASLLDEAPDLIKSTEMGNEILSVYPKAIEKAFNSPYAELHYFSTGPETPFSIKKINEALLSTHYFFIDWETDSKTLDFTSRLNHFISRKGRNQNKVKHPYIIPYMRDSRLHDFIKQSLDPREENSTIIPFGSRESEFSNEYIFCEEYHIAASRLNEDYLKNKTTNPAHRPVRLYSRQDSLSEAETVYNYYSNTARYIHIPYKLFDIGVFPRVGQYSEHNSTCLPWNPILDSDEDTIAWVEHRRWNAYLRSAGFTSPLNSELDKYFIQDDIFMAKNLDHHLHICLVESHEGPKGKAWKDDSQLTLENLDALDMVTAYYYYKNQYDSSSISFAEFWDNRKDFDLNNMKGIDFKIYDYRNSNPNNYESFIYERYLKLKSNSVKKRIIVSRTSNQLSPEVSGLNNSLESENEEVEPLINPTETLDPEDLFD